MGEIIKDKNKCPFCKKTFVSGKLLLDEDKKKGTIHCPYCLLKVGVYLPEEIPREIDGRHIC